MNCRILVVNIDTHEYKEFPGFEQLQNVMRDICIIHKYSKSDLNLGFYGTRYEFDLTEGTNKFLQFDLKNQYSYGEAKCQYYQMFLDYCSDAVKTGNHYKVVYQYVFQFCKQPK